MDILKANISNGSVTTHGVTTTYGTETERFWFTTSLVSSWILTVLILTLNICVIVCILRYKRRSRLYLLLMHMAVADLCTGFIDCFIHSLERTLGYEKLVNYWFAEDYTCKVQRTLLNTSMLASNYILAATSLERAIAISKPLIHLRRGHLLQKCAIAGCWLISVLLSIPIFRSFEKQYVWQRDTYACGNDPGLMSWTFMINLLFVSAFAVPFVVIVISYIILLQAIFKRASSFRANSHVRNQAFTRSVNRTASRSKSRSIKLMCGIVSGSSCHGYRGLVIIFQYLAVCYIDRATMYNYRFLVSWLPWSVIIYPNICFLVSWLPFMMIIYLNFYDLFQHPSITLILLLYYCNSITNPIVFFVYHRHRRRESLIMSSNGTREPVITNLEHEL